VRAILTYHSIDDSDSPISVRPATLRRHVEWLARSGPRVVTVDELRRLPPGESAVAITFDDAFVNFADQAWPLLRAHALPVTLYVATDHAGGRNAWSARDPAIPDLPILGRSALARLAAQGVTLGSHTRSHARLPRLPAAALTEELEGSARRLEEISGARPHGLAYPYGAHDERVARAAAAVYDHACTTELRPLSATEDAHRLPRVDAYYLRTGHRLEWWGSPRLNLYLRARAGARGCRALLAAALGQ
jgi:peptidoglycan/xylan/chitin deacetylase (PgdA/CDA1 family)